MKNIHSPFRFILLMHLLFFLTESPYCQYVTNGTAVSLGNDCYRLTTATTSESGNVLSSSPIDLSLPFELYAILNFGNVDVDGADGITFIFANNNTFVGTPAQNLGYGSISPSFAVEIDTWDNGVDVNDPVEDHIGIQQNGDVIHGSSNTLVSPIEISNVEDGEDHCVHVSWDPATQFFALTLDNTTITYTGDIAAIFGGNTSVYYGFTSATGGFFNEHTVCFTANPAPIIPMEDLTICEGETVQLQVDPVGDSYHWTFDPTLSATDISDPTASPSTTTTYSVQVGFTCGEPQFDDVTVTVNESAAVAAVAEICAGESILLGGEMQEEAGMYTDILSTVNGCDSTVTTTLVVHQVDTTYLAATDCIPANVGVFEEVLSNQNGCDSLIITTITLASPNECLIDGTLAGSIIPCEETIGSLTLEMITGEIPFTYQYTGASTGTGIINNLNEATTIANLPAGDYTVIITDNNGISTTLIAEIEQFPPPVATANIDHEISCFNEMDGSATVSATGGQAPYTYEWSTSETSPTIEDLFPGVFTVTVTDANNCTDEAQVTLTEPTALTMSFTVAQPDCFDDSNGSVEAVITGGTPSYQFAINGSDFQPNTTFTNLQAGTYQITAQDANGCTVDEAFAINASISVDVDLGDDQFINLGDEALLNALINVPLDSIVNLTWTNISDTQCQTCPLQVVAPIITTTYTITVQASNGCIGTDDLTVFVDRRKSIYVPNIFSPNGDGTNDVFYPFSATKTVKNIKSFKIFSRWGNLVFEHTDFLPNTPAHSWDGTFQSQEMNPGVFVWYAEVEFIDGEVIILKGDVALIR